MILNYNIIVIFVVPKTLACEIFRIATKVAKRRLVY